MRLEFEDWSCGVAVFKGITMRSLARLAVLMVLAFSLTMGNATAEEQPNLLLIVSDDQRPDTIHALGNPLIETPNLDWLVRNGVAFTRAICPNPICTPSRAEIMTGASSFRNGVMDFGTPKRSEIATMAETLRRAGYRTRYVGKWHNNGRPQDWGYEATRGLFAGGGAKWDKPAVDAAGRPVTGYRGWILQTDDRQLQPERGVGLTRDISRAFADAAIEVLQEPSEQPLFLHVNFTAPHDPLLMPPGYENKYDPERMPLPKNFLPEHPFDHGNFDGRDELLFARPRTPREVKRELAVYYAVISHMDEQIGRLLHTLRETEQLDRTLIAFTSDHGLAIGSHGLRGKQNMYEHTIGVPLILSGPDLPKDRRITAQCYQRDLFPTFCDIAHMPIPDTVEGHSLVPVLRGEQDTIYPRVFAYFRDKQRMVRDDRWKLIWYPPLDRYQLFDLSNDPDELHDLSGDPQHQAKLHELQGTLHAWQREVGDPVAKK